MIINLTKMIQFEMIANLTKMGSGKLVRLSLYVKVCEYVPWSCTIRVVLSCSITWMIYVSLATIITIKTKLSTIGNFTDRWSDVEQNYRCTPRVVVVYNQCLQTHNTADSQYFVLQCALDVSVLFLCITHERHPIACHYGRGMGCRSWVQIWLKFYHCNCCAGSTFLSYITAIYQESIIFVSK